jgi:phage tail sheath protein FI
VRVTDLAATYASPDDNPATGTFGPLSGGDDGLVGLADADFYGSTAGNGGATGLYVFNRISRIDIAAIPGRCTPAAHAQLVTWCEVYREGRTFAIVVVPSGLSVGQARTYVSSTAALQELSEIASCYGPWIYIDNPSTSVFGTEKTILVPPEGALMGMFCRVDSSKEGGAFEHPSNALGVLTTARGVEHDEYEDPQQRGLAFDTLINSIRAQRGKPVYVDGARCLKSGGPFPTVGQSRGAMLVSNQIVEAYDVLRNAGIREGLYVRLATGATVYLGKLTKANCFRSKKPAESFFVDFGAGLNTPDVAEARQVLGTIGLGGPPPAEFIFVTVTPFAGLAAKFAQQVQQASPGGV